MLMKEKAFKIVGVSNDYRSAYDKLIQSHPEYILLDPQVLSQQEFSDFKQAAQDHQATVIVFSKSNEYSLASVARYIKKPDQFNKNNFSIDQILHAVNGDSEMVPVSHHRSAKGMQASAIERNPNSPTQVMLIDDSALMKIVISNVIKSAPNMQLICSAENGKEGLEKLQRYKPDVILLDLEMPVMDGESFLKAARSQTQAKIIVVSSIAHSRQNQIRALGADAFVEKPDGSVSMDFADKAGQQLLDLIAELHKN